MLKGGIKGGDKKVRIKHGREGGRITKGGRTRKRGGSTNIGLRSKEGSRENEKEKRISKFSSLLGQTLVRGAKN